MRDFWFKIDDKIRFILIGIFNATMSYIIYSAFCFILGESSYQIALALAWIISSVISFSTQKFFVFQGKELWIKEYLKCCTTWFFSYLINAGILEFIVKTIHLNVYLSQIIATAFSAVFTYIMFKKFAFKKENKEIGE